jgi:aspartate aminotransferase
MTALSGRLRRFKPSPFVAAARRVAELTAQGRQIVNLNTGEPDFPTPENVQLAAVDAMRAGQTKYTAVAGTPALKAAIASKFRRENGLEFTPDQIIASAGCKQVIFNALMASLDPGDEVIIPAPYWMSYPEMVLMADGRPVVVSCLESQGFKLRPADLAAAITPRTKWLFLNSPSNPTGACYGAEELAELASVLHAHPQVRILSDDIYEHLRYGDRPFVTIAEVEPRLSERTLTVNGPSKTYAMTGWRIGFAGGARDLIDGMVAVQSQATSAACSISQAATVAALDGPQDVVRERAAIFRTRRDLMVAAVNEAPGMHCVAPDGAFYVFANCAAAFNHATPGGKRIESDADFAMYLLEEHGIAVLPGTIFGLPGYIRMCFAVSTKSLEEAGARLQRACRALL